MQNPVSVQASFARSVADGQQSYRRLSLALLDSSLAIQEANEAFFRQFGGSPDDFRGRTLTELVDPSVQQWLLGQLSDLLAGGRDYFVSDIIAVGRGGVAFAASLTVARTSGRVPHASSILVTVLPALPEVPVAVDRGQRPMSPLEARILEELAAGTRTNALAQHLYMSRQAVEYHITRLLRLLNVPNRTALVSRAYSLGILKTGVWPPQVSPVCIRE